MHFGTKVVCTVALVSVCSLASSASGQDYVSSGQQLFANQYTQGMANQATAEMYVAPVPTPAWVGHTYYTYQPFYPHEMLHSHVDRYHNYYDNGRGLNRTSAYYYSPPVRTMVHGMWKSFSLPR